MEIHYSTHGNKVVSLWYSRYMFWCWLMTVQRSVIRTCHRLFLKINQCNDKLSQVKLMYTTKKGYRVKKWPTHLRELSSFECHIGKVNMKRILILTKDYQSIQVSHFYSIQQHASVYPFYSIQQYLKPGFKIRTWKGFCLSYKHIFVDLVDVGTS